MESRIKFLTPLTLTILIVCSACSPSEEPEGGGCEYQIIEGEAEIVSISPASSEGLSCSSPLKVVYNFQADDPNAVNDYRHPDFSDFNRVCSSYFCDRGDLNDFIPMSKEWVETYGLQVGATYKVNRVEEIGSGSCYPVSFDWVELAEKRDSMTEESIAAIARCATD